MSSKLKNTSKPALRFHARQCPPGFAMAMLGAMEQVEDEAITRLTEHEAYEQLENWHRAKRLPSSWMEDLQGWIDQAGHRELVEWDAFDGAAESYLSSMRAYEERSGPHETEADFVSYDKHVKAWKPPAKRRRTSRSRSPSADRSTRSKMPAREGGASNGRDEQGAAATRRDDETTSEDLLRQLRAKDAEIEKLQQKTKKESGVNKKIRAELRELKKRALEDSSGSEDSSESEADGKGNKANDVQMPKAAVEKDKEQAAEQRGRCQDLI